MSVKGVDLKDWKEFRIMEYYWKKTLLKIKKKPRIYSLETSKYYNPPRRGGCVCVCVWEGGGVGGDGRGCHPGWVTSLSLWQVGVVFSPRFLLI